MKKVRTIFLSDIHLGTRACQAERLLSFLREHEADHVYLLGDIIDFWSLGRTIYWPPEHNTFIQKMLKRARHGTKVVFVPGNHDEALREYVGTHFGDIEVVRDAVHTTADGRRLLLMHGDEFDQVTRHHRWVAVLGDMSYSLLLRLNALLSWIRRKMHRAGYWSLAGYAKRKVKGALDFIYGYEESVAHHVRQMGLDGVVCGHIHSAVIKDIDGVTYINCGDWVDSCTAIVEHADGRLELVQWGEMQSQTDSVAEPASPQEALHDTVTPIRALRQG
jgi:UDP-2,3-diacylglucosamine pyrophosphatase LpxH